MSINLTHYLVVIANIVELIIHVVDVVLEILCAVPCMGDLIFASLPKRFSNFHIIMSVSNPMKGIGSLIRVAKI